MTDGDQQNVAPRRRRLHVHFTQDITLGSVLTIAIAILMTIEVGFFYDALSAQISEARDYQNFNREAIERLQGEMSIYNKWSFEQSADLRVKVEALSAQVQRLQDDVQALKGQR